MRLPICLYAHKAGRFTSSKGIKIQKKTGRAMDTCRISDFFFFGIDLDDAHPLELFISSDFGRGRKSLVTSHISDK